MTLPRVFIVVTAILLSVIGVGAYMKKQRLASGSASHVQEVSLTFQQAPIEINLRDLSPRSTQESKSLTVCEQVSAEPLAISAPSSNEPIPEVDRIDLLFQKGSPLPIVETIKYKSRVPWKPGRAAWLIDYAFHYKTPLDFVARSINNRPSYTVPSISDGVEFNVLKQDKDFHFYLVCDLSRHKLWLYYVDPQQEKRCLLKTYNVGLGRLSSDKTSGCLTPLGRFKLGSRIAVFKPKMMGLHRNKRVELITVFGTRWIPFDKEVEGCSEPAKGFGLHGTPWNVRASDKALAADDSSIGKYESDGCIRFAQADIEELYAIITTRDTFIEIVKDFHQAKLPYQE